MAYEVLETTSRLPGHNEAESRRPTHPSGGNRLFAAGIAWTLSPPPPYKSHMSDVLVGAAENYCQLQSLRGNPRPTSNETQALVEASVA